MQDNLPPNSHPSKQTNMSTPPKKLSTPPRQDKSDVLSLLLSIESMYEASQNVLNTYTQTTLLLSIATEAQLLVMKLRLMKERWLCHLPFKEACGVDFFDWSKKVGKMSQGLIGAGETEEAVSEYCPSKHFLLDLYELLPGDGDAPGEQAHYYEEQNIPRLVASQERIRRQLTRNWRQYKCDFSDMIARMVDQRIGNVLLPLADKGLAIRMVCCELLQQLSEVLYQLYEMPVGIIQRDQFARLAERVITEQEYGGRKAQAAAARDVRNLKNVTPEEEWPERCNDEIKASIDVINEMKYGQKVFNFLGSSTSIKGRYSGLGRFLNSVRKDISKEELYDLLEQLFRILYLREDSEQEQAAVPPVVDDKEARPAAKDAQSVWQHRRSVTPERPRLPLFFNEDLVGDEEAVAKFYDILHHCGFYIGRALLESEKRDKAISCYEGWKWKHLRQALMNLGFIRKDTTKKGLAEYLEKVFPYLDAENVKRGFNYRGGYEDIKTDNRIVKEMEDEFEPVADLLG